MIKLVKFLLSIWEKSVVKLNRWQHIPNSEKKALFIAPHIYQGSEVKILDGTTIQKGDLVAEIHVDNLKAAQFENDFKNIFRVFDEELATLTKAIDHDESFKEIKAYHGTTPFDPILRRRGFTIIELKPGLKKTFLKIWVNTLRTVFRRERQMKKNRLRIPKEFWISREQLLQNHRHQ